MWARLLLVQRSVDSLYIRHIGLCWARDVCVCVDCIKQVNCKRRMCLCGAFFFPLDIVYVPGGGVIQV